MAAAREEIDHRSAVAFLANIYEYPDGSYSDASWVPFTYEGAAITTGNTVYQDTLMGIFMTSGVKTVQSYAVTFDPETK